MERDCYRRTGIFPILHTVVVTRELANEHPDLVKAVYLAFCTAKDRMQEQYVKGMTFNNMSIMLPWFSNLIDEDRALLGDDWWPYGIQRNRSAIDVVLRYHHEQGLTKRRLTIEDVFFPDLLDTQAKLLAPRPTGRSPSMQTVFVHHANPLWVISRHSRRLAGRCLI